MVSKFDVVVCSEQQQLKTGNKSHVHEQKIGYSVEYYIAVKKSELLLHTLLTSLTDIMLDKRKKT